MDKKLMIALGLIVVVVVAAAGAYLILSDNDSNDNNENKITGRCVVFGNANNDDYIDQNDMTKLKEIIAEGTWDYKLYPYADVNNDGSVNQKDVDYLDNILNKKNKTQMYYVGMNGNVYSVTYPAIGNIGCNMYYGLYDAMAIGIYDRVTGVTTLPKTYSEDMFPGVKSMDLIGTNYTYDPELMLKHDIKYILGSDSDFRYEDYKPMGIDVLMLKGSGESAAGITVISSIISLGAIFDCREAVEKYTDFMDGVMQKIEDKAKQIPREYTYVMPYNPTNSVENEFDTEIRSTGEKIGDVYAMSLVPTRDLVWSADNACPVIQTEDVMKWDPDFIVVSMVASLDAKDDPADVQKTFNEWFDYYKMTNAYKNGNMIGISYDSVGSTIGPAVVPLICHYMWPDIFDEDEGYKILEEAVREFTMLKFDDIRKCGGLIVYTD